MGRRTAVHPGPLFYCLLASSLLFRRRPFSALFCSPRPSLLYGPRLPLVCGRYGTVPVTPLSTASLPPSHWSRPPVAAAWRPLRCAVSSGDFCSPSRRRSGHGAGTPSPARTPSALSPPTVCPGAPTRFRWGSGLGSTVGACCMGPPLAGTPPSIPCHRRAREGGVMRFSNRGRFLPRRALPSQRLASWEPRTAHARADGAQNGGASNSPAQK